MAVAPILTPELITAELTDDESRVLGVLRGRLGQKENRNRLRSAYYDGKHRLEQLGISIPPQLQGIEHIVGWPAKSVDVLEQRLNFEGFTLPVQSSLLDDLMELDFQNNMLLERTQAHICALIHGTAFVFVTAGEPGTDDPDVVYSVRSARQATAIYNRRTRRLEAALEVINERSYDRNGRTEILYLPTHNVILEKDPNSGRWTIERRDNPTGRVLCAPLVHRPFIEREFGMSRITRPVMTLTDSAVRTMMRTEVSAEFYSSPQRYVLGAEESQFVDGKGKVKTGWETVLGRFLAIPHGEYDETTGETPPPTQVGQFPQMTMQPHLEQLREIATMFAGETSIPVSYLGIIHDNPASADAINAGEADLTKVAERDHVSLGSGWENMAKLGILVRDQTDQLPEDLTRLRSRWGNPATPTRQAAAQSVMSLVSTGVYLPDSEITWEQLGLDQSTIERLKLERRQRAAEIRMQQLTQAAAGTNPRAQQLAGETRPAGGPAEDN